MGRCPSRSARPFALRVLAPPRFARSPQKASLEDLSVCYPRVRHVASGMCHAAALRAERQRQQQKREAAMRTTPPATLNPFTWRGFANVRMGDYLLGEDTVDLASLGFCGDTVTVSCSTCGEVLGHIAVELLGEEFRDLTTAHITPVLDWHDAKYHPRRA